MSGSDTEVVTLRNQIVDLEQKFAVGLRIVALSPLVQVPGVDLLLQVVTPVQERLILRRQVINQGCETVSERIDSHSRSRNDAIINEFVQGLIDLQSVHFNTFCRH